MDCGVVGSGGEWWGVGLVILIGSGKYPSLTLQ